MILVDTSVWVDHLNGRPTLLPAALQEQLVLVHPFVIGELACGSFPSRAETLRSLHNLPAAMTVTPSEVLKLLEHRQLMGSGIGYIDAHLIASVLLTTRARLLTSDKRLATVATRLKINYE